jgi:hypothetical protein
MLIAVLLASSAACAQSAADIAEAKAAAEKWLKLVDAEEYSLAYNSSSAGVRDGMPKFAWTTLISATHLPLGNIKSRTLKQTTPKPGGSSISFEYESRFEKNAKVSESVTTVHEKDGAWRVTGYNINDEKR